MKPEFSVMYLPVIISQEGAEGYVPLKERSKPKKKEDIGCREQKVYIERDKGISSMISESKPRRTILQLLLRTACLDWSRTLKNCMCGVSTGKKVTDRSSDKNDHVKLVLKHFGIEKYCKI